MRDLKAELVRAQALPRGAERWAAIEDVVRAQMEEVGPCALAVSGSRHIADAGEVYAMLARVYLHADVSLTCGPLIWEVIQGGGKGVDSVVDAALELWAADLSRRAGHTIEPMCSRTIPALWSEAGRAAGPRRNAKLLDASWLWAGLWDGRTERCGTLDAAEQAAARGWVGWAVSRPDGEQGAWLYAVHPAIFGEEEER